LSVSVVEVEVDWPKAGVAIANRPAESSHTDLRIVDLPLLESEQLLRGGR
jgi:hypothetical protein